MAAGAMLAALDITDESHPFLRSSSTQEARDATNTAEKRSITAASAIARVVAGVIVASSQVSEGTTAMLLLRGLPQSYVASRRHSCLGRRGRNGHGGRIVVVVRNTATLTAVPFGAIANGIVVNGGSRLRRTIRDAIGAHMRRDDTATGVLCALCRQFTKDLFTLDFAQPEILPPRWEPQPTPGWGPGFRHHESIGSLRESSLACDMCNVLYQDLAGLGPELCQSWLGLYPFWSNKFVRAGSRKGQFRVGFRESLSKMTWGSVMLVSSPLHSFKICRREALNNGKSYGELDHYQRFLAVPTYLTPDVISLNVAKWQRNCRDNHTSCQKSSAIHNLPTRVIDLGKGGSGNARIYESQGEAAPYIALSHCWGGTIASRTVEANLVERCSSLNVYELPRNFQDAITVAKAFGVRYLWIDALCIIQDSVEDWAAEASRMASIYAGAVVVVSVLDAASSTIGFLGRERAPLALADEHYGVQKMFPPINDYLATCPLNTRGWCMQERLLAPTILHIGKEQMLWECATNLSYEDTTEFHPRRSANAVGIFQDVRVRMLRSPEYSWEDWYLVVEEYTARGLTVSSDKLPALAGAASLFKSHKSTATYIAGLWEEDLSQGLLWGAHYNHSEGRRVWGYSSADVCSSLAKPSEKRAPSWSWAALDGRVDFWASRVRGVASFDITDVSIVGATRNDLGPKRIEASLKIRGRIAPMVYHPNAGHDVGTLTFGELDAIRNESTCIGGCVMDIDRQTARPCYALMGIQKDRDWYLLLLEKNADKTFERIGFCTGYGIEMGSDKFVTHEFMLV
ncbi:putative Heterokaryon incompatibility protein-domain-containing protein [Seiridium cardinale]